MGTNYLGKTPLRERKVLRPGRNFLLLVSAIKKTLIHNKNRPLAHKRLYASSMAFKTILALVPALAIAMALLSGQAFTEKGERSSTKSWTSSIRSKIWNTTPR